MKEHPKYKSTKPLMSDVPGKINMADILFIKTNQDSKHPLYVQVDVCNKYVTGVIMTNRTKTECTDAILAVNYDYAIKGRCMEE